MTTAAKFPAAVATLANLLGEYPSIPANELTLNADITSGALSIVATANIPSSWPQPGSLTIDSEVILYDSYTAATFTVNAAGRGTQTAYGAGAAAAHTAGATIGLYTTAQAMNQILAEIIAIETQLLAGQSNPNLAPNSDVARRTVFGLAMPETFADTTGYVVVSGAPPTVAGNIVTSTAANELAWASQSFVWNEGRASATFKAVATAGIYELKWRNGATSFVSAKQNNGNFTLNYQVGAGDVVLATVAQALTLNRWYWLEIEKQQTTFTVKLYDTGGTASGVIKSASTLLQTLMAPITAYTACHIAIKSDQATAQWGGIATVNGGVYVETTLPESLAFNYNGTVKGGQCIGYDEAVDAGPIGQQRALRAYIPVATRSYEPGTPTDNAVVPVIPSTAYTLSAYVKVSGLGGSGALVQCIVYWLDSSKSFISSTSVTDAGETSWTRKSITATSPAGTKYAAVAWRFNTILTATGTGYGMCAQLEQGSAATAWRNAPGDATTPFAALRKTIDRAATTAINFPDAPVQEVTMTGNATFTIANPIIGQYMQLRLRQDHVGARTYSWPTNMKWSGGSAPTGSPANKLDIVTVTTDGTNLYGTYVLNY